MRWYIIGLILFSPFLLAAQPKQKTKKYPSLLWEITGNGLAKPSYLFGTMHVSSKLAFHLADSFFLGIRNADVVALETNPETWQEDISNFGLTAQEALPPGDYQEMPEDFLYQNTLKFFPYSKKIARALYSNPPAINNLLYRSWGNETSDFEEDTYLDMYIYQCGKKWGKKVAGVEKYAESMKLMMEAYRDAAKDRNVKERSYDNENSYSYNKLQEAYRSGNLDWLDSINKYNSFSPAFDEKFLYRRNEIQASSIDSILRSGQSLFVGVGAAHLPGTRGVIEMLRQEGYRLRPIKMGARDSRHKNLVEQVRVPVRFATQVADDGLFKVDIPGKFYKFGEDASMDQRQFADMANGSYYLVTRITTNAWMFGHNEEKVFHTIDSMLYENVPGKIIARKNIVRNGYKGIDLTNKTRRGDVQRYNIFVTPFEVIIFKMSGTGEYVKNGSEATKFFGSVQLKEYKPATLVPGWKRYSPRWGGFSIDLPHEPYVGNDGSWIFDAADRTTQTHYRIVRTDIHNYHFAEEDSFDLELLSESFQASEFIDSIESSQHSIHKGYPSLDCRFRAKNGSLFFVRFLIQGPHYYTLVAHGKKQEPAMQKFLQSFDISPYRYDMPRPLRDTSLYFSASSVVQPEQDKEIIAMPAGTYNVVDELPEELRLEEGVYRSRLVANDSTGEKIYISFFKMQRYRHLKDSARLDRENHGLFQDSTGIVRFRKKDMLPGGLKVWEAIVTDTGSSRAIWTKSFYKDGIAHTLYTQIDTLSGPSKFLRTFYDSFRPADTLQGVNPFTKKSDLFFADFLSSDSLKHERALRNLYSLSLDSSDLQPLQQLIQTIDWKEKKYLETKKQLIGKLEVIRTTAASDFLRDIYYAAGDTVALQYKALETLLHQQTQYAYAQFRSIMENDPPVLEADENNGNTAFISLNHEFRRLEERFGTRNSGFMEEIGDSLELAAGILPGLLPLINIDDYRTGMMQLLTELVDSGMVDSKSYDVYFSKFFVEARLELKKQLIAEKKKAIEMAERKKQDKYQNEDLFPTEDFNSGNERLRNYAILLLPYYEANSQVRQWFGQIFRSSDRRLKYHTFLLMLRNGKPYNDSLIRHYASSDDYRYELFRDLQSLGRLSLFPNQYRNHAALAKSKLLAENYYEKPDTLVYLDRLPATIKNRTGFIYFFKYRLKKDDVSWKLATVGLVPDDASLIDFPHSGSSWNDYTDRYDRNKVPDFTEFTDIRINEEMPLKEQLTKALKRLLYSNRKSGQEFYGKPGSDYYSDITPVYDED